MMVDLNKVLNVTYNYLNLPQTVTVGGTTFITYTYDAAGRKLKKYVIQNGLTQNKLYTGGMQFTNNLLDFIMTGEGKVMNDPGGWRYEYYLKDHLGNTRLSFDNTGAGNTADPVQEDGYYPYGLTYYNQNPLLTEAKNLYLYNGIELQEETGLYATLFRLYDPVTGRFIQIDPLANFFPGINPYSFGYNNPILYGDPDGLGPLLDLWRNIKDAAMSVIGYDRMGSYNSGSMSSNHPKNNVQWVKRDDGGAKPSQVTATAPNPPRSSNAPVGQLEALGTVQIPTDNEITPPNIREVPINPAKIKRKSIDGVTGSPINIRNDNLFDLGDSKISRSSRNQYLSPVANDLIKHPILQIIIVVRRGQDPGVYGGPNQDPLLKDRARAIQKALIELGVSPEQVRIWQGEYGSGNKGSKNYLNRDVTIKFEE